MKREIICGIYKITSPSGKIYIGQAVDIYDRWRRYKKAKCRQPKLDASFKKYGVENHKFEIVCNCDENQLDYLEKYLIRFYDTFNTPHGLNLTDGGHNGRHTEETKLKISIKNTGRKKSKEEIDKNRIAHLGIKTGPRSVETKKKLSDNSGAKVAVYQLDENTGEILNEYDSVKSANAIYEIKSISNCLQGKNKTAAGYKWINKEGMSLDKIKEWEEIKRTRGDNHLIILPRIIKEKKIKQKNQRLKDLPEWNLEENKRIRSETKKKMWAKKKESPEWINRKINPPKKYIKLKDNPEWYSEENRKKRSERIKSQNTKIFNKLKDEKKYEKWLEERRNRMYKKRENSNWNSNEEKDKRRTISVKANEGKKLIRQKRLNNDILN